MYAKFLLKILVDKILNVSEISYRYKKNEVHIVFYIEKN